MPKTDILIIGTGIAGLSFAIKTAIKRKDLSITIMTKELAQTTNTRYAQGGIAVVIDRLKDSFDKHISDTLESGGGECDPDIVEMVVYQAPERLQELIDLGVAFDKKGAGFDLAIEGGHSQPRILHHQDSTGLEIEEALLRRVRNLDNITLLENHYVIDLVTEESAGHAVCVGAFYFDDHNAIKYIRSKVTVLSTGGCGQIFQNTTNAGIATGDGVAIAHRAAAEIRDMQYIQFHPTAMYEPDKNPCFLLSEALRGFGAHIVNEDGKRFVFTSDTRGEMATRDIVSKAIIEELQKSGQHHSYLDCRHLDQTAFKTHFESIYNYCKSKNIDPFFDLIPIVPVAHYQCGGILVNSDSQTTVSNLYAIGECARTGLHGRNRLASNSLLEAVVFAHQAAQKVCSTVDGIGISTTVYLNKSTGRHQTSDSHRIAEIKKNIKSILTQYYIDDADDKALADLKSLEKVVAGIFESENISKPIIEMINMLTVATLVVEHAKQNNLITF